MKTDHKVILDNSEPEPLAKLSNVELEGVGKGKLSLTGEQLEFERKNNLFSTPNVELTLPLLEISSIKVKAQTNTLIIESINATNQQITNMIRLPNNKASANMYRMFDETLRQVQQEAEQREQMASYQKYLWKTAYRVWITVELLFQIIQKLSYRDWDAIDALREEVLKAAEDLNKTSAIDITGQVQSLVNAVPSRNKPLVLQGVIPGLDSIGTLLCSDFPPLRTWDDIVRENPPGLSWRDIKYIFFFAVRYRLTALWQQDDEMDMIMDARLKMNKLMFIVSNAVIGESTKQNLSTENEVSNIIELLDSTAEKIETTLKTKAGIS